MLRKARFWLVVGVGALVGLVSCSEADDKNDAEDGGGNAGKPPQPAGGEPTGGSHAAGTGAESGIAGGDNASAGAGGSAGAAIVTCTPSAAAGAGGQAAVSVLRGASEEDTVFGTALDGCGNLLLHSSAGPLEVRSIGVTGALSWTHTVEAETGTAHIAGVQASESGIAYVVGGIDGQLPGLPASAGTDSYVRKLGADGAEIWTAQLGSEADESLRGSALGGDDALFLLLDADGKLEGETAEPTGPLVVTKLGTSDGKLAWTYRLGDGFTDAHLAADREQNSYVLSGTTLWVLDAEGREAVLNLEDLTLPSDLFPDNDGPIRADTLNVSTDGKQIYIAGTAGGDDEFESTEAFVAAVGPTGNQIWMVNVGFANAVNALAADPVSNGVYVVGLSESYPLAMHLDDTGMGVGWEGDWESVETGNGSYQHVVASSAGTAVLGYFWTWGEDSSQVFEPWRILRTP